MSKVVLKHVCKIYEGGVHAVSDFNLEIKDKEFVVFVGPSGCGKSTTLRMIAGLEDITSGQLFIDGKLVNDVDSKDRDIAMVFQNYALYPHMSVYQNMAFGLKLRHLPPEEIDRRVNEAAEILELKDLLSRKPKALSGGQCQRVALGRAIVREPKVFLLDEPLSNLDAKLRVQTRTEITKLHKKLATTFVYVTHDQTEAMTMGDRIVVMKLGRIQQVDTPANLYENPTNLFVATFLGSPQMNILDARLEQENGILSVKLVGNDSPKLDFPLMKGKQLSDSSYVGREVFFGIRPEHVHLSESGVPGEIQVVEQLGDETILYVKISGREGDVVLKAPASVTYRPKEQVYLAFEMEQGHLFDKETTHSIMGIPRENRLPCFLHGDTLEFGTQSYALPKNFQERILQSAYGQADLFLSFSPKNAGLSFDENALAINGTLDFSIEKTGYTTVFLKVSGCTKDVVFALPKDKKPLVGEKLTIFIKWSDVFLQNAEGDTLISRDVIYRNDIDAVIHHAGESSFVSFGKNKVVVDRLACSEGTHRIRLSEDKVSVILSKAQSKKTHRKNPVFDPKSLIRVSAYDEEPLGNVSVVFVQIKGMEHYAAFLVPSDFSAYKTPKFFLAVKKEAITVVQ